MQIFSSALKRQMKDCILAIFWSKKEIFAFIKDCSVLVNVLKLSIKIRATRWDSFILCSKLCNKEFVSIC